MRSTFLFLYDTHDTSQEAGYASRSLRRLILLQGLGLFTAIPLGAQLASEMVGWMNKNEHREEQTVRTQWFNRCWAQSRNQDHAQKWLDLYEHPKPNRPSPSLPWSILNSFEAKLCSGPQNQHVHHSIFWERLFSAFCFSLQPWDLKKLWTRSFPGRIPMVHRPTLRPLQRPRTPNFVLTQLVHSLSIAILTFQPIEASNLDQVTGL